MLLKDYFAYMDENAGKGTLNNYDNIILIIRPDKEPIWLVDVDIDPRAQQMARMDVSDIEILTDMFDGII